MKNYKLPQTLDQKQYKDKVVAQYFSKYGSNANIKGEVFSSAFTTDKKIGRRFTRQDSSSNTISERINDDIQNKGYCVTANNTSYLQEPDVWSSGNSTLAISSSTQTVFSFLVYLPDTLVGQGYQKLYGRSNDLGIQILTTSNGLSVKVQGNYRPFWLYEFTDVPYKLDNWNWITVFRDSRDGAYNDTTLDETNTSVKLWVNGLQSPDLTNTANTNRRGGAGNSAVEWTLLNWSHVDNGLNAAEHISLFCFLADNKTTSEGNIDLTKIPLIHNSTFNLETVENLYKPFSLVGLYFVGNNKDNGFVTFSYNTNIVDVGEEQDIWVYPINNSQGFINDNLTTPYSLINDKGYNQTVSLDIVPVSLSNFNEDVLGNPLEYKGKLAPRAQIVDSAALQLNGINKKIQVSYQPTSVSINGIDDTSNWTFTDVGAGNWTLEPNSSKTVYDLVINGSYYYPCSENNGTTIYDVSGNNNHGTVINAVLPDIWTTQDAYHWSFYEGYWLYEDASSNQVFLPIDAGASVVINSVTFNKVEFVKGYKQTSKWNGASKIQFPEIPEMPSELRGQKFSKDTIGGVSENTNLSTKGQLLITSSGLSEIERQRESIEEFTYDIGSSIVGLALHRYNPNFSDNVIEIHETGGNTTQWFAFESNGELPTANILSFVGTNDGHVINWVDQADSTKIWTNSTPTSAPRLVIGGTLQTQNGNPILDFNGAQWLEKSYESYYQIGDNDFEAYVSSSGGQQIVNFRNSGEGFMWENTSGVWNFYTRSINGGDSMTNTAIVNTFVVANFGFERGGAKFSHIDNGTQIVNTEDAAGTWIEGTISNTETMYLGRRSSGEYLTGDLGQVLVYTKTLSSNRRSEMLNSLKTRFI